MVVKRAIWFESYTLENIVFKWTSVFKNLHVKKNLLNISRVNVKRKVVCWDTLVRTFTLIIKSKSINIMIKKVW